LAQGRKTQPDLRRCVDADRHHSAPMVTFHSAGAMAMDQFGGQDLAAMAIAMAGGMEAADESQSGQPPLHAELPSEAHRAWVRRVSRLRVAAGALREQAEQDYRSPVDDPPPGVEAIEAMEVPDGREATQRLSAEALRATVERGMPSDALRSGTVVKECRADGWDAIRRPVLFDLPPEQELAFHSRESFAEAAASCGGGAVACATALECAVAAQFGPRLLTKTLPLAHVLENSIFAEASDKERCEEASQWPLRAIHDGLPAWLRGHPKQTSMVLSMGRDGRGYAFHWSAGTWLLQLQGQTMWFLYDPGGPPSKAAYKELSLCPAPLLPHAIARLVPKDRPLCVMQRAGEGIFLPAFWWCASLNIGDVLSVGGRRSVGEIDVAAAVRDNPTSAGALFELCSSLRNSNPGYALSGMKRVLKGERSNFFYMWQRINMLHRGWPKSTVPVGERFLESANKLLNKRQQYLVIRMVAPSLLLLAEVLVGKKTLLPETRRAWRIARAAVAHVDQYVRTIGCPGLPSSLRPYLETSDSEEPQDINGDSEAGAGVATSASGPQPLGTSAAGSSVSSSPAAAVQATSSMVWESVEDDFEEID